MTRLKMYSTERIALILLATILGVWALALMLRNDSNAPVDLTSAVADTIIIRDTVYINKSSVTMTKYDKKSDKKSRSQATDAARSPLDNIIAEPE